MANNFAITRMTAIKRAIESCETTGYDPENHIRGVTKMVKLGSGAERAIEDFMLTRYACYITKTRPLADFLPTLTIAAKNLATEITNHNIQREDLRGEHAITGQHVQNNESVRNMLGVASGFAAAGMAA